MNPVVRTWKGRALGLAALVTLSGCTVTGEGYVGAVYEPVGYEYGAWQTGYYVAPPRHGHRDGNYDRHDRRDEHRASGPEVRHVEPVPAPQPSSRYAYRPAPSSVAAPSIPMRPAPPGRRKTPPGHAKTPPGHEKNHR